MQHLCKTSGHWAWQPVYQTTCVHLRTYKLAKDDRPNERRQSCSTVYKSVANILRPMDSLRSYKAWLICNVPSLIPHRHAIYRVLDNLPWHLDFHIGSERFTTETPVNSSTIQMTQQRNILRDTLSGIKVLSCRYPFSSTSHSHDTFLSLPPDTYSSGIH